MTNTLQTILTRRSIRAYTPQKISKTVLKQILSCGLAAPSSKNSQPWKFYILNEKKKIQTFAKLLIKSKNLEAEPCDPKTGKIRVGFKSTIKASGEILTRTPLVILVENTCPFSHRRSVVLKSKYKNGICGHDSEMLSIGAAIENICLAAHALDLSSVIIADAVAEEEKIKKIYKMRGDFVAAIALGYPTYQVPPKPLDWTKVKYF